MTTNGAALAEPSPSERAKTTVRLSILFGLIYFVQGVGEPTSGLIAQPVRSMLRDWGLGASEIASFMLIVGFPWYIKPVFGLLSDFVPILGSRRKSYLLITTLMAAVGLIVAGTLDLPVGSTSTLMWLLLLPCVGVAFTDVVADALMVEKGQPLGITGRLQSVQWGALYFAGVLTGVVGGFLSEHNQQQMGFVICGALTFVTFFVALFAVKERRDARVDVASIRKTLALTWTTIRGGYVVPVAAFLFLLNFNPFSGDVQYIHMTAAIGLSEQFVGTTYSVGSVASIIACGVYGVFAPKLRVRTLIHLSLVTMVLSSLGYWGMVGETSALIVSALVGFFYMITTLTQLDMAARYCPSATAATIFALLMSLSNLSTSLSSLVGGHWYEAWTLDWGAQRAFNVLVAVGALFTAACWLLLLVLPKEDQAGPAANAGE